MPLHLYKMKITHASLIFLLLLASCGGKKEPTEKKLSDYKIEKINELVGIARIEPANKIYPLGSELAGKITRILVVEGQVVKKGQLLLEMDESTENAQVTQSAAKITTRNEKIKSLQAKIEALSIKLKAAEVNMKRDRALADSKAGTDKNAIDSENIYQNLQADIIIAKAEVNEAVLENTATTLKTSSSFVHPGTVLTKSQMQYAYNKAIDLKGIDADYAAFQKAISYGFVNKNDRKIRACLKTFASQQR